MELTGEIIIFAPRPKVWAALNDPAMLARCIDGCESLAETAPDRFEGRVVAKVGPVRAAFTGVVTISDAEPPARYRLSGEGKGGAAGFAKGEADVNLAQDGPDATRLTYGARATVGGKLAQLGGRLIEGTARGYADRFFAALKAELEVVAPSAEPAAPPMGETIAIEGEPADIGPDAGTAELVETEPALVTPNAPPEPRGGLPLGVWVGALAVMVLVLLAWLLRA